MRPSDDRFGARVILVAAAVVAAALLVSRTDYVPFWDGRIYADCIVEAWNRLLTPGALRCAGHASHAYVALAALVQRVGPGTYPPILLTNALLFLAACIGFHRLLTHAFPVSEQRLDRAFLTACFVLHPATLAAVVQPGLDLALLPGFIWCAVFLLERRWTLLVAAGIALVFTKETGVLLYAGLVASYAIAIVLRAPGSIRSRVGALFRLTPLAAPGVLFALYLLYRATLPNQPVLWRTGTLAEPLLRQFLVPRIDLYQINYLMIMFVLNFAWVATFWIGWDLFVGTVRTAHRLPRRPVPGAEPRTLGFLVLLSIVTMCALTRFKTFGHTRYFLPVFALSIVLLFASLIRFGLPVVLRRSILALYGLALLMTNVRTVDPVSRWIYPTFPIGNHDMLQLTFITGECCAKGLDQLVYSPEFTVLQDLEQDALAAIAPVDSTVLVVPDSAIWYYVGPLDATTHRRTLRRDGLVHPAVVETREIVGGTLRPRNAWFLAFPNGTVQRALQELSGLYVVGQERRFWRRGYSLSAYPLSLRGGP